MWSDARILRQRASEKRAKAPAKKTPSTTKTTVAKKKGGPKKQAESDGDGRGRQ